MRDKWINVGHEGNELKPHTEPAEDFSDTSRIDVMVGMGFSRDEIQDSLNGLKYNEVTATYLLLGRSGQKEASVMRSGSTLSLSRSRTMTNGTSKPPPSLSSGTSSTSHKPQRSASTYHPRRRHSDFSESLQFTRHVWAAH
uniref:non-specific serine/threonine protein kinase n=1 Tax=Knipowitschia caucasica TaxID=637954 RepID=A0AAV2J7F9_KNICA